MFLSPHRNEFSKSTQPYGKMIYVRVVYATLHFLQ